MITAVNVLYHGDKRIADAVERLLDQRGGVVSQTTRTFNRQSRSGQFLIEYLLSPRDLQEAVAKVERVPGVMSVVCHDNHSAVVQHREDGAGGRHAHEVHAE